MELKNKILPEGREECLYTFKFGGIWALGYISGFEREGIKQLYKVGDSDILYAADKDLVIDVINTHFRTRPDVVLYRIEDDIATPITLEGNIRTDKPKVKVTKCIT